MLDDKILDRARRRIKVKFADRRKALPKEVNRVIAEVQKIAGTAQCSGTYEGVHTACTREISTRAKIVFDSLLRVHKIYDSPITNMLAIDLKEEISRYIEAIVEEISKYMIQRLPMSKSDAHYFDFENIKREVIERISVKVDLYVDSLLCKLAEKEQNRKTTIFAIIISFIVDLVFELLVYFVPFTWVKNHPNSYGLQGSIIFLIPCLIVGLFKPQYRKWCWGVGAIAFIVLLLSLMGGPADINVN